MPVAESHEAKISVEGNTVRYRFAGINLPHAAGENQGYVLFKIKAKENIEAGEKLENEASIFFDFNEAIKTNKYSTLIIDVSSSTFDKSLNEQFLISPSPATQGTTVKAKISDNDNYILSIYSLGGKLIDKRSLRSEINYPTSHLEKGIYILELKSQTKRYVKKLVVM